MKYNRSKSIPFAITFSSFHDNFFTSAASLFSLLIYKVERKLLAYTEAVCKRFTVSKTCLTLLNLLSITR